MNMQYNYGSMSPAQIAAENARFMTKVYTWMTFGIFLTAIIAYYVASTPSLIMAVVTNKVLFYGLIIAQLGAVFGLSAFINKISAMAATFIYLLYASLTGITLSTIFLAYTASSIQGAFFVTAFSFAGLSLFGYVTKKDLGPLGTFVHMGLWGLIGFSIMSWIFPSLMGPVSSRVFSIVGVIVFAGLTAYDTQKIKQMNIIGNEGTEEDKKETILGALTLYLDFINLFLMILRLMGGRRD